MEFVVPYESGARRITSNLGSDLFCPLWLVGLAHLEWRARVARSCCIGRRWSVGCSPLVLDRSSWSVVGSFLKFGRNSTCCQYGGGNVLPLPGSSLSQLFGVDHLSSRSPLHRLGEGFLAHLEHYAAARVHSATLRENRPSHGPHGEWPTTFQDLVRKGVRRCCGASARVLCPGCGQRVLFVASTLAVPSVTTKVSNECQRRRKSAHQRSLSRLEAIPLVGPHSLRFHQ